MKKLLGFIFSVVLILGFSSSMAMADAAKGQKLYSKKLKKACGFTGAKMAAKHTQDEWEEINKSGKLVDEIKKVCPNVKSVKKSYIPHLYDFFYKYASDSGNVPSC